MDTAQFDTLSRALMAHGSRRSALATLLSGRLGLLHLNQADAKKGKKKPCPPCRKRKKGKCKGKLPDGSACPEGTCQGGSCVAPQSPPPPGCGAGGSCVVFLSSTKYTGNLGGLEGADAKCQTLANAAGLPGAYKAWLSDLTSSPKLRFTPSTGPYRLVNGTTIAANWTDLTDGALSAPINVTETGATENDISEAWSATKADGTPSGPIDGEPNIHCSNWSQASNNTGRGALGRTDTPIDWSYSGYTTCNQLEHLYCFQQSTTPTTPPQTRLTITTVAAAPAATVLPGACYAIEDTNAGGASVEVCDDDDGANNGITTVNLRDASSYVITQTVVPNGYQQPEAYRVTVPFGQETRLTVTNPRV